MNPRLMPKPPIPLTETLAPALLRAGLETLPVVIRKRGERASRPNSDLDIGLDSDLERS